jgi:predicted transcriptional regulator
MIPEWYHPCMALTVRTDAVLEEALTSLAKSEGASRQEVIRRAVIDRYERAGHGSRVAESTQRMVTRWGDVLERLGAE